MRRFWLALVLLASLVALALWIADRPSQEGESENVTTQTPRERAPAAAPDSSARNASRQAANDEPGPAPDGPDPRGTRVEVRVLHPDRRPWSWRPIDITLRHTLPYAKDRQPLVARTDDRGIARFDGVDLGQRFVATGPSTSAVAFVPARGIGPTGPGQTTTLELLEDASLPILTGRLVAVSGKPVRGDEVPAMTYRRLVSGGSRSASTTFVKLALHRGALRHRLPQQTRDGESRLVRIGPVPQHALVDLSRQFPNGEVDLGEIRLGGGPHLVSGHVTDGESPVSGARISIARDYGTLEEPRWVQLDELVADSADDGAFVVRGPAPAGRLRAQAALRETLPSESTDFRPGQKDLTLVLRRAAGIRGSVELRGMPNDSLLLSLQAHPPVRLRRRQDRTRIQADGTFAWSELDPGVYDVTLRMIGVPQPIRLIDRIAVQAGRTVRDPRLQGIALPRDLRKVEVSVVDPDGKSVAEAWVELVPPDAPAAQRELYHAQNGRVAVILRGANTKLVVRARGHHPQRITSPGAREEVTLAAGLRVLIRLQGEFELPPAPAFLRVALFRKPAPGERRRFSVYRDGHAFLGGMGNVDWVWRETPRLDAKGRAEVRLAQPGTYFVTVEHVAGPRGASRRLDIDAGPVELRAGQRQAVCEVRLR